MSVQPTNHQILPIDGRLAELDWLLVGLIFAVFLHHVLMPFNGDGWHVVNADSSKLLDDIMVYFEQLRLQTLFFIAGVGSLILLRKSGARSFLLSKLHRLLVPFLFGMMVVVPPQAYFEHQERYSSLLDAYAQEFLSFDTNHLWFIEFLIVFMLLAPLVKSGLGSAAGQRCLALLERLSTWKHGLFVIALPLVALRCGLQYLLPSDGHKIEDLPVSLFFLYFFLAGMCFASSKFVWNALATHRRVNLYWLIASSIAFYLYYFSPDLSGYLSLPILWMIWWMLCTLVSWSGMLTLLGYAGAYLKASPKRLKSVNELIYPFYILHQTVIVAFAFYIVQWQSGIAPKAIALLAAALSTCLIVCIFVIRPIKPLRFLFGLKKKSAHH